MAHQQPLANLPLHISSNHTFQYETRDPAITFARIRAALSIFTVILLSALFLRVALALFLIDGPSFEAIKTFTNPFVSPFNGFFPYPTDMIQIASMLAFSIYYLTYWVLDALVRSLTPHPHPGR